jgi:signal transduction histidine kinase/CheY-like chemotaxis protein
MSLFLKLVISKSSALAWLIFILGLLSTFLFAQYLETKNKAEEAIQFSLNCDRITTKVKERFNVHTLVVLNTVARVRSTETINRDSFKKYVEDIQINQFTPGIYGLGLNTVVKKDDLERFERKIRAADFPEFKVRPVGDRNLFTPVTYLEPLTESNIKAIGFDTYSNPIRKSAQDLAMDSGSFAITKKIELVQDNDTKKAGIILFAPVYKNNLPTNTIDERRNAIQSFVSSPFQMDQMMAGILSEEDLKIQSNLVLQVFDSSDTSKQLLFTNAKTTKTNFSQNLLKNRDIIQTRLIQHNLQDHWQLEFQYVDGNSTNWSIEALITLISGTLLSIIAFLYVLSKIHLKEAVKKLAENLTEKNTRLNQRLSLALGAAEMGVWDYDPFNNILIWDKKQFEIFGITENQFEGLISAWESTLHPDDKESAKNALKTAIEGGNSFDTEFRIFRLGEIRYIKGQGALVRNESQQVTRIIGVNYDITELRNSQDLLEEQKYKAEIANIAKSDFIAKMSHEIRTPMNGIIGLTSLASRLQLSGEIRDYFSKISLSANSLLKIVNQILDFSKLEAGRLILQPHPFNLNKIMEQLNDLFLPSSQLKKNALNFYLDPNIPIHLIGDETRIRQVLINLIDNAIKFTNAGIITVSIKLQEIKNNQAVIDISVRDTGIGIDTKDIPKILRPFEQADDKVSRKFGGTGLGLSISQELLELMHSSLNVESELGIGSHFSFKLHLDINPNQDPIYLTSQDEIVIPENNISNIKVPEKTVLIAEDNPINATILTQMLQHFGVKVLVASNGLECVDIIKNQHCDLVLMDIQMPEMDGFEASLIIRENPRFNHIPIIGVSAGLSSKNITEYTDRGMQDKLDKPFTIEDLSVCLKKHLF